MVAKGWKPNLTTSSVQGLWSYWMSLGDAPVITHIPPHDVILVG